MRLQSFVCFDFLNKTAISSEIAGVFVCLVGWLVLSMALHYKLLFKVSTIILADKSSLLYEVTNSCVWCNIPAQLYGDV